ncbi:M16 family metallopeptidase [Inhella sp.]|uniref:M16 family metallopeptidase n=1 Tax=Inhella sp. TaxID=1921806 RepID=UPI0035B041AA
MLRSVLLGLALLAASLAATAQSPKPIREVEGISEYRLANGLQVLLAPDASKPTTTVNVTYRVGSKHENYGETGMAHLLEHLLFKGSPRHPNPWAEFAKRGLNANGTTWYDRTNYFASFSANPDTLKWYLGWQADAMVNSFIAKRHLVTEFSVVRNEMEMGENNPAMITWERLWAAMFQWHNYGKSTIGARTDVENVSIDRLKAFYKLHYQPDNATLMVSGKFEPRQTLAWIQQAFGSLPRSRQARPVLYTLDPVQDGERSVTVRRSGGTPSGTLGYHVPPVAHPDFAAVELIGQMLAEPPAGRLHKKLVEELRIASSVSAYAAALAEPSALMLGADAPPGGDAQALAKAMIEISEGLAAQPFAQTELDRARVRWLNRWEQLFSNPEAVGQVLSEYVAAGDWRLFFLLRDRVKAMRLEDVQRVAQERLLPANRTLALYLPTDKPQRAPKPEQVDAAAQLKDFVPQASGEAVAAFDASPLAIEAQAQRLKLDGGAQAVLLSKPTRGARVSGQLQLRFGNLESLRGQRSTSDLLAALLDKGTRGLDRQALRDRLDALKMELQVRDGTGGLSLAFNTRREHAVEAVNLVFEMLREPRLEAAALEEVRSQFLSGIEAMRSEPEHIVNNRLGLLRSTHPAGDPRNERSWDGTVADLKAVTLDGVRAFHARHYGAQQLTIGLVGDFDRPAVQAALQAATRGWQAQVNPQRLAQPWADIAPVEERQRTPDKQNATFGATLSLPIHDRHPDFVPLMLADYLLGANTDSRLWVRIREKDGLSYGTWSGLDWNAFEPNSSWSFGAIFAPQNRERVEKAFREELARALKDGFSPAELGTAQRALLNYRALSRAQDGSLAGSLALQAYLGRDMKRVAEVDAQIQATTLEQVNTVLRRYLKPEQFQIVWAGDFQ